LGDFVLTLPVLRALRDGFPGARIVFAGRTGFGGLAAAAGLVDEVLSDDRREVISLYSREAGAADGICRSLGPILLAASFVPSAEVTRNLLAAGAGEVCCLSPVPREPSRAHAADHLASILRGRIDIQPPAVPRLAVPDEARERARGHLRARGVGGRCIVLHPGSGGRLKNWPADRFVGLAARAREELGLQVVAVAGPAEAEPADACLEIVGAAADALIVNPPLDLLAGMLAGAAACVGNDSGVSHLAAACGAPTVAVFGPTDPAVWAPRGASVAVVRDPSGDVAAVRVDDVMAALEGLASERRPGWGA